MTIYSLCVCMVGSARPTKELCRDGTTVYRRQLHVFLLIGTLMTFNTFHIFNKKTKDQNQDKYFHNDKKVYEKTPSVCSFILIKQLKMHNSQLSHSSLFQTAVPLLFHRKVVLVMPPMLSLACSYWSYRFVVSTPTQSVVLSNSRYYGIKGLTTVFVSLWTHVLHLFATLWLINRTHTAAVYTQVQGKHSSPKEMR